jgi:hypothetical protein
MLVRPIVGLILAGFGVFLIENELKLFSYIKAAYLDLHQRFVNRVVGAEWRERANEDLQPGCVESTAFDYYVRAFMIALVVLSFMNVLFLCIWLAEVSSTPPPLQLPPRRYSSWPFRFDLTD